MKIAIPYLLAGIVILQAGATLANSSGTYDETLYLKMAEGVFQQRDNAEISARGVAPLPILLQYSLPAINYVTDYGQAIQLARLSTVMLISVPMMIAIYLWLAADLGIAAGALAAALVALSPNMVAHGSLATTDACFVFFALLTLLALTKYLERPTWRRLAALIVASAFAFAAKYSGIALVGIAGGALLWMDRPERTAWRRFGTATAIATAMFVAGLIGTANYHPIDGLLSQINHQSIGHEAYLFGTLSNTGWWYYQLVALALKSTYVELTALGIAAYASAGLLRERSVAMRVWALAAGAILLLSMTSRVSIGMRYVLMVVPLTIMMATTWVARRLADRPAIAMAIGASALAVQATIAIQTAPRYLSYFNAFAGGPMNGYKALADSNLDWGQDLPAMRQILASVGAREPLAAYFGSASPEAYDVHIWPWTIAGPDVEGRVDWIVISATYLVGLYLENDPFKPFRAIEPSARPTPSLFVYDTRRPEVKAALAEATLRKR